MSDKPTLDEKLTGSLWDRIGNFFVKMWAQFWQATIDMFSNMSTAIIETFMGKEGYKAYLRMINKLSDNARKTGIPDHIEEQFRELDKNPTMFGAITKFFYSLAQDIGYILFVIPATLGKKKLQLNKQYEPGQIGLETLVSAWYRNPKMRTRIMELGRENGLSESDVNMVFSSMQNIPMTDELRALFLRGKINMADYVDLMRKHGYSDDNIARLQELYYFIPPVADLVTMAVREVFTPSIVHKYGQDQDFPSEFGEWAGKQGVSPEWARHYWAAHWTLPSLRDGYEMLHRGVINFEELNTLLRTQDVMPYWREKLTEIAYSTYTRVDVRRMFKVGVLDEEQVKRAYLDLGYDEERAMNLTSFTVQEYGEDVTDYTKGEVLRAYGNKIITKSECVVMLEDLGLSVNTINLKIQLEDYKEDQKAEKIETTAIGLEYKKGIISLNKATAKLGNLNLPATQIEALINKWDGSKAQKPLSFPTAKLEKLYKAGIISKSVFKDELDYKGYSDKYINWFIALADIVPQTKD